jgi:hypothetical protein
MRVTPALSPRDRARLRARSVRATLVVAAAIALYAALVARIARFVTDDTYIHLQYARHLRDGDGLVFNAGERVYGTTSPLWSVSLGVLGALTGADLLALAKALSIVFGALAIVAVAFALRRFLDAWVEGHGYASGRAELAWALGLVVFAADAWLVRWSASGMETSLAVFLVAAGFAAYFSRRPWGVRLVAPAVWWSFAALARPEAGVLLVLLVLRVLLSRGTWVAKGPRIARIAIPALVVVGPWLAYAASFYGSIVPATLAAKTIPGPRLTVFIALLMQAVRAVAATRAVELVAFAALVVVILRVVRSRRAEEFVPLGWFLGLPLFYAARGVAPLSRYLLPAVPLLVAYAWAALLAVATGERRRPRRAAIALGIVAALSLLVSGFTYSRYVVPQANAFGEDVEGTLGALGRWVDANLPEDASIAMPDIGAFAYYAHRRVVDLAGLVTPEITPLLARYPYDELVTGFHFEGVARPEFLVDRAARPRRLLFESPYATCVTPLWVGEVDRRGIQRPEPAYYTLYRIDWEAFDRMTAAGRQARAGGAEAGGASSSVFAAITKSLR